MGPVAGWRLCLETVERFAQRLAAAGFDEAMTTELRAEEVLCGDETPINVIHKDTDEHGQPVPGSPHAVIVRTPDARLIWYAPISSRSKTSLAGLTGNYVTSESDGARGAGFLRLQGVTGRDTRTTSRPRLRSEEMAPDGAALKMGARHSPRLRCASLRWSGSGAAEGEHAEVLIRSENQVGDGRTALPARRGCHCGAGTGEAVIRRWVRG